MINITEKAQNHMKNMLAERGKGEGIRVGVKPTGCSGYGYIIEYADTTNDDDSIIKIDNLDIIIDSKSKILLEGLEIDFVEEKIGTGLKFTNPNSKSVCGCGESFTV